MANHYEIIFLVHPNQSDQVPTMVERYQQLITSRGGQVHRLEDWGRRALAYPIQKVQKAHYMLMNIESDAALLKELVDLFRFNDAVLRHLVVRRETADTGPSAILRAPDRATSE